MGLLSAQTSWKELRKKELTYLQVGSTVRQKVQLELVMS